MGGPPWEVVPSLRLSMKGEGGEGPGAPSTVSSNYGSRSVPRRLPGHCWSAFGSFRKGEALPPASGPIGWWGGL